MDTVPIAQVYAVVKDYADYRGRPTTDAEVKLFVDRFLAKRPDPKACHWTGTVTPCKLDETVTECPGMKDCVAHITI